MILAFTASLPVALADYAGRWVRAQGLPSVHVLSSGAFRLEELIRYHNPDIAIYGNDISLASCALGTFLIGEDDDTIVFQRHLADLNGSPSRVLALIIALNTASHSIKPRLSFENLRPEQVALAVDRATSRAVDARNALQLTGFTRRDLRDVPASSDAAALIGFPPAYADDYERFYRWLPASVAWTPPPHRRFTPPDDFRALCDQLRADGRPWLLFSDAHFPELPIVAFFDPLIRRPVYGYGAPLVDGLVHSAPLGAPSTYASVEVDAIGPGSSCIVAPMVKSEFLHAVRSYTRLPINGSMDVEFPFAVYCDGGYAGSFGLRFPRHDFLEMLCDFAVTGRRRLSKLIPMLARSREVREYMESRTWSRTRTITTAVFTDQPYSMKYRGSGFEVAVRKPGNLTLHADWSEEGISDIFSLWLTKHCK